MTPPALASLKPGDQLRVIAWWKKGPSCIVAAEFIARHGSEFEVRETATKLVHYVVADAVVEVLREDSR